MKSPERKPREDICPGHIIQGNPDLKAVINKSHYNRGVFFEHKDAVNHCAYHCRETTKCTEAQKKEIAELFRSYGKDVVEYQQQAISNN